MIRDTNLVLVLVDGSEISVVYPHRVGREYATPWLEHKGSREWNINVEDSLTLRLKDARFIVGKWGTGYDVSDGVEFIIPFQEVARIRDLSPELLQQAEDAYKKHHAEIAEMKRKKELITREEYEKLLERVDWVENIVKKNLT